MRKRAPVLSLVAPHQTHTKNGLPPSTARYFFAPDPIDQMSMLASTKPTPTLTMHVIKPGIM